MFFFNKIKFLLLIVRLINVEELICNISSEILFTYSGEEVNIKNNKWNKEEYINELKRNKLICKCILGASLICWYKLEGSQCGWIGFIIMFSEIIDRYISKV